MTDPDEGYVLRPEIEQRLLQSLLAGREQLLSPDQAWRIFLASKLLAGAFDLHASHPEPYLDVTD